MKRQTIRVIQRFAVFLVAATGAVAATGMPSDQFYDEMGGQPGIVALVDRFASHLYSDPKIGRFFEGVNPKVTRERLEAQFCDLAGGPCKTINPDMRKTHSGIDITRSDFDAVVSLLTLSMQECSIPLSVQQRLLQTLMPMKKDIVNTPR